MSNQEKLEFQTETKQILDLVIHSLYTNKEIFLRELISNASDALDKLRFEALQKKDLLSDEHELKISIKADKDAKTVTISDNGIGMTKDDLINNIGTIARSGSKAFLENLAAEQKKDSNLIGQFGVGFYSVFMVAKNVKLITKRAGENNPALCWESTGDTSFTISEVEKEGCGTDIIISLKDDATQYAESWQLRSLIKKHSDYIAFPIYLQNDKGEDEVVNESKPIWMKSPSEISEEQYNEFYKSSFGKFDEPSITIHNKAEGVMEYSSLLYIPSTVSPFEMYNNERKHGVKLYVKRVFIMDDCKDLLPSYLRFVNGVVDSEDLPLNVSRETLQDNPLIKKISKAVVGKILSKLTELSEKDPDKYKNFWKNFGFIVKEGLHSDFDNRDKLLELVRFQSSNGNSEDDLTSLKQYVERMREGQKEIYYITGDSRTVVEKSPHLEIFKEKGIEVLYMVEPIDEFILTSIFEYDGKSLKSATKGNLDIGDLSSEEKKAKKEGEKKFKKLSQKIKEILDEDIKEVRVTNRLKESPCCLVSDENDAGSHMEKLMKAMGQDVPKTKKILEINADHDIFKNLNSSFEKNPDSEKISDWAKIIYDQALISEGELPKDPADYLKRVNTILSKVSK